MNNSFKKFKDSYPEIQYREKSLNKKEEKPASFKANQHKKKSDKIDLDSKNKIFSKNDYIDLQYWRLEMIDYSAKLIGKEINGKCMEVGSGKGIATAYLSSKKKVN